MFFARRWWRSDVVTDAEFIALRYDDRAAEWLRTFRAALYGLVYNVIILGWVLRAMGKIVQPLLSLGRMGAAAAATRGRAWCRRNRRSAGPAKRSR